MRKFSLIIVTILSVLVLVACGNSAPNKRDGEKVTITQTVSLSSGTQNGETTYKRSEITTEFTKNPKRIAVYALGVLDIFDFIGLDVLGIEKLALPFASVPERLNQYTKAPHVNGGTLFEVDHETLQLFRPDLIILDGRNANLYEDLKQKYAYADILDATSTTYSVETHKAIVNNLSKLFDNGGNSMKEEMASIETEINAIKGVTKDYKALFIMSNGFNQSKIVISVSGADGRYGTLHNDFGFLEAAPGGKISGGDSHGLPVTLENLTEINPDVIFIMDRAAVVADVSSSLTELKNEPIFKSLNAVKNNYVFDLDSVSWYTVSGGFNSTRQMINDIKAFVQLVTNKWNNTSSSNCLAIYWQTRLNLVK